MDRASHECQGLKSSTEGGMDQLRGALGEKIEALSMAVGKKVRRLKMSRIVANCREFLRIWGRF